MTSFTEAMATYKKQLQKGAVQSAYQGIMEFLMALRTDLQNRHPEFYVSGNFYQGYMDFTYFAFTPQSLKERKLRVSIVFIHKTCEFKIWLGGVNKSIQAKYWKLFKENGWSKYYLVPSIDDVYSIVEGTLAKDPDFGNLPKLSKHIEKEILAFAKELEKFLSKH